MNDYIQLYNNLARLPAPELVQILADVLPIGEIKARMDGTVVLVHAYGLRRFQTTTDLRELGITEDDPRSKVFTTTMQTLVSEKVQGTLRNHASRVKKICRNEGAVEVWEGTRKAWWVPVECFDTFTRAVETYVQEFSHLRDRHLLDNYDSLRSEAEMNYIESLKAAYEELSNGNGNPTAKMNYLDDGSDYFDRRFPTREEIRRDIRMEMEIVSKSLPPAICHKVETLRETEVQALTAEAAAQRAVASRETEQMELVQIKKEAEEELSSSTVFESFANDIFSLLQNGDREGVLSQIHTARSQHREQLDELENLYQYVVQIVTRKEVPV